MSNNYKLLFWVLLLFTGLFNTAICQQNIKIKTTGIADETIKIKTSGIADESIKIKTSGIADKTYFLTDTYDKKYSHKSIKIKTSGFADKTIKIKTTGIADKTIKVKTSGIADKTIKIISNPHLADYVIITSIEQITSLLADIDSEIMKMLVKNFSSTSKNTSDRKKPINAFKTKIAEDNDEILKLDNGAIIEVTSGYLGYIGYRKDCIVFKSGYGWKIWIEGKKVYRCDVLKEPNYSTSLDIEEVNISEISDDGEIIFLTDGSVYEVSYQSYETSLWLGYSSALLINGYQIINLDEGSEIIDVIKIK